MQGPSWWPVRFALAQTGLWKEENSGTLGVVAGIQIPMAGARRLSWPVPMQGPAGFHGNLHTVVRAGEALGSHLVQPLWGL